MKLASYNVENLFQRARALNQQSWEDGREALQWQSELNRILGKSKYTAADKKKIVDLIKKLGIDKRDDGSPFVILRQNRGHLLRRPKGGSVEIVANSAGGVYRMGVWGGKNGTLFPHYPEITQASEAASDHAAIWAEIDV